MKKKYKSTLFFSYIWILTIGICFEINIFWIYYFYMISLLKSNQVKTEREASCLKIFFSARQEEN